MDSRQGSDKAQKRKRGSKGGGADGASKSRRLEAKCRELQKAIRLQHMESQQAVIERERLRAIGELAHGVAHDVNNVLAALRLRVGILQKDPACVGAQNANLAAIERILAEGTTLVTKLQQFGYRDEAPLVPVDLAEAIRLAVEIAQSGLRLRGAETGVQVHIRCKIEPLPMVRASAEDLRHVFVNLLLNARDAMPSGGTVTIRAGTEDGAIVVRVEDEGHGIPPTLLPRIFDPFFTTKGIKGTGIGLAMAKSVMKRIGSSITASNRPEGGACFELRFATLGPVAGRRGAQTVPHVPSGVMNVNSNVAPFPTRSLRTRR